MVCPAPTALSGVELSRLEALHAAVRAGLPVARYGFTTDARRYPLDGLFAYRKAASETAPAGCELTPAETGPATRGPVAGMDCRLREQITVTAAGPYLSRTDIALSPDAVGRLQQSTGCPLWELQLAPDRNDTWRVSHLTTFPQRADWEAARVIAVFLTERAQAMEAAG